jgi:hypothetical protein
MTYENFYWWLSVALFSYSAIQMIVAHCKNEYDKATFYLLMTLIFLEWIK